MDTLHCAASESEAALEDFLAIKCPTEEQQRHFVEILASNTGDLTIDLQEKIVASKNVFAITAKNECVRLHNREIKEIKTKHETVMQDLIRLRESMTTEEFQAAKKLNIDNCTQLLATAITESIKKTMQTFKTWQSPSQRRAVGSANASPFVLDDIDCRRRPATEAATTVSSDDESIKAWTPSTDGAFSRVISGRAIRNPAPKTPPLPLGDDVVDE